MVNSDDLIVIILRVVNYRKHQRTSGTFLLKMSVLNWGYSLSARTSEHHAR